MTIDACKFAEEALSTELPPASPLRLKNWVGLAFDRNRYADFAPYEFWKSLFEVQYAETDDGIDIVSKSSTTQDSSQHICARNLDDLRKYWTTNAQFLKDHYLVSAERDWVIRLDQDITLFAAKISFASVVVRKMGGFATVMNIMTDDFGIGLHSDDAGLLTYLRNITGSLREIS